MNPYDPQPPELLARHVIGMACDCPPLGRIRRDDGGCHSLFMWFRDLRDSLCQGCRLYDHDWCWGATIVRVSYEDDELFARAVRAIRRLTLLRIEMDRDAWAEDQKPPLQALPAEYDLSADPRIRPEEAPHMDGMYRAVMRHHISANPPVREMTARDVVAGELLQRHHNMVLEDREALDGADAVAAELFHREGLGEREDNSRSGFFIYLDGESIERLSRVPGGEGLAGMTRDDKAALVWETWVRIVHSYDDDSDDEGYEPPEFPYPLPGHHRRLRLGMWFDLLQELSCAGLEESGAEGEGHEFCPGRDVEWTFCPGGIFDFPGKSRRMEELYGPVKPRPGKPGA